MSALWVGNCVFHSVFTTLSHKATFAVLGNIRKRVCGKLTVCDMPSGLLKNVPVERIESIETTLAHIVPEFTSDLLVPIGLMIYLFVLDRRMLPLKMNRNLQGQFTFGAFADVYRFAERCEITSQAAAVLTNGLLQYLLQQPVNAFSLSIDS